MTTRVLASSLAHHSQHSLARPMVFQTAKRSLQIPSSSQLSHAKYPCGPFQPFLPHSRGHTRLTPSSSPSFLRGLSTCTTSAAVPKTSSIWTKATIGGTIALATSATLLSQITKSPVLMENGNTTPPGGSVVSDLKDEHNRIGVEKKSNTELMLSMLVYKLCTFSLLVDMAPKLITLAEMLHLTPPVYWFVRNTFFAQFCG
ncbi:hypothetical protein BG004_005435, partial [Podila humilis]